VLAAALAGATTQDGNDAIHIVPDSRNQPAEFTETRFPLLVESSLCVSTPAAPVCAAAGQG